MVAAMVQDFQGALVDFEKLKERKEEPGMDRIKNELEDAGYEFAVAVATQAEIAAGAACGQLAIICEK